MTEPNARIHAYNEVTRAHRALIQAALDYAGHPIPDLGVDELRTAAWEYWHAVQEAKAAGAMANAAIAANYCAA